MGFRRLAAASVIVLAWSTLTGTAMHAEDYPTRPVTVVVPTGPGGGMEMVARLFAPKMEQRLGKPFVIENRPGAGTNIGAAAVARVGTRRLHAADGDLFDHGDQRQHLQNPAVRSGEGFDAGGALRRVPFVLVVNPSSPVQTAADLIKLAKDKPGTLSFGTSGTGTASHLFAELFKIHTGIAVTHVPYKSMMQPLNDVLGGHLQFMFSDLSPALPLIRTASCARSG